MSTWIKLHDNFATNLKVLAAGEDAAWVYVSGLLFCSANETDGKIPTAALRTITAKRDAKTLARILVREGLWIETAGGWEVHDYLKHQRSKAQIEAEREATRKRAAKHRASRSSNAVTDTVTNGDVTASETEAETDTEQPPQPPLLDRIVDLVFDKVLADKQRRGERITSAAGFRSWWDANEAAGCRKRAAWVVENFDMPSLSHYADATLSPVTPPWAGSMMRERTSA